MDSSVFDALRIKAREKIDAGALPKGDPTRVNGDRVAHDTPCNLCGQVIKKSEFSYLIKAPGRAMSDSQYILHFLCHAAWQVEVAGVK
jgi:hypothetical protein